MAWTANRGEAPGPDSSINPPGQLKVAGKTFEINQWACPIRRRENADNFGRKDGRRKDGGPEDIEMSTKLLIPCLGLYLVSFTGCAETLAPYAGMPSIIAVPALAEVRSGIYVVVRPVTHGQPSEARPGTSASEGDTVLLTQDRRLYVKAPDHYGSAHGKPTELAAAVLKAHRNNIYEMAVNTTGISHATVAIRRGGRVLLETDSAVNDETVVIARRSTETDRSHGTDKRVASRD